MRPAIGAILLLSYEYSGRFWITRLRPVVRVSYRDAHFHSRVCLDITLNDYAVATSDISQGADFSNEKLSLSETSVEKVPTFPV